MKHIIHRLEKRYILLNFSCDEKFNYLVGQEIFDIIEKQRFNVSLTNNINADEIIEFIREKLLDFEIIVKNNYCVKFNVCDLFLDRRNNFNMCVQTKTNFEDELEFRCDIRKKKYSTPTYIFVELVYVFNEHKNINDSCYFDAIKLTLFLYVYPIQKLK